MDHFIRINGSYKLLICMNHPYDPYELPIRMGFSHKTPFFPAIIQQQQTVIHTNNKQHQIQSFNNINNTNLRGNHLPQIR